MPRNDIQNMPFDMRPGWMTWVDLVEKYADPACRCGLCVAVRAWIQQSAERTEKRLMDLQDTEATIRQSKETMTPEQWDKLSHELMISTLEAELKLRALLQGWKGRGL